MQSVIKLFTRIVLSGGTRCACFGAEALAAMKHPARLPRRALQCQAAFDAQPLLLVAPSVRLVAACPGDAAAHAARCAVPSFFGLHISPAE